MVRSKRENTYYADEKVLNEFYGLSTDNKPTENVATGSVFFEVDTGDIYLYDEIGEEWIIVSNNGGGG